MNFREYVLRVRVELKGWGGSGSIFARCEPVDFPLILRQVATSLRPQTEIDIRWEEYRITQTRSQVAAVEKLNLNYIIPPYTRVAVEVWPSSEELIDHDILLRCEYSPR